MAWQLRSARPILSPLPLRPIIAGQHRSDYAISDGQAGFASGIVNLTVGPPATTRSLFSDAETPEVLSSDDTGQVNLGVQFVASSGGAITGIKFYKGHGRHRHPCGLALDPAWDAAGDARRSPTRPRPAGRRSISNPVEITAGTTYVASYHSNGHYAVDKQLFRLPPVTNGLLTAPGTSTAFSAYRTRPTLFPTGTYHAGNYWVDVLFISGSQPITSRDGR